MKKIFAAGLLLINACSLPKDTEIPYMDISVVQDVTDPHLLEPDASPILKLYDLANHSGSKVRFRYHEISDMNLVPVVQLELPGKKETDAKNRNQLPNYREQVILQFYTSVRNALSEQNIKQDSTFKAHSECFQTISEELQLLKQSNSTRKTLLVYSNLFENSAILSVYAKTKNIVLAMDAESIRQQFEKTKLLPDNLSGIEVCFLFRPASRQEDQQFGKMFGIYKAMLEERGAKVSVLATNSQNQIL